MTKDILLHDNGTGGDIYLAGNDLVLSETFFQSIYLALFGGNIEASTQGNEREGEQRNDYWGNSLLFVQSKGNQFNSETEKTLSRVVLSSKGRIEIKKAVEKDLQFLKSIADISIEVSIQSHSRVEIRIKTSKKSNSEKKEYQLVYDNATKAIIIDREI